MADSKGNVDNSSIVGLIKFNKFLRRAIYILGGLSILLLVSLAAVGVRLGQVINTTGSNTQGMFSFVCLSF